MLYFKRFRKKIDIQDFFHIYILIFFKKVVILLYKKNENEKRGNS